MIHTISPAARLWRPLRPAAVPAEPAASYPSATVVDAEGSGFVLAPLSQSLPVGTAARRRSRGLPLHRPHPGLGPRAGHHRPGRRDADPATIAWTAVPTAVVYTGPTFGDFADPLTLSARLTAATTGQPLAGQTVSFTFGAQILTG